MIRQSHSWAWIWRKPWFQKIDAPQCSTIYKDMEVTYMSIDRWMDKEDVVHIYSGILWWGGSVT